MLAKGALAIALMMATTAASAERAGADSPMHVEYSGLCSVPAGVSGNWDVYQEIFQAGAPTWLPTHIHDGVECTTTIRSAADWWVLHRGIIPLPVGKTFNTPEHTVHTAGNAVDPTMQYMAIHVITAGDPFRRLVNAPSAPKQVTTATKSIFKSIYTNQPSSHRGFDVVQRLETLAPGGSYSVAPSSALAFYTMTRGSAVFTVGTIAHALGQFQKIVIPRGVALAIVNRGPVPVQMAVCELRDIRL